jgi:ankyrin repeat protein
MSRSLPVRPNLDQYKKQAKELLRLWKAGDADARRRVAEHHPRFTDGRGEDAAIVLADAQLVLAREHGFPSWAAFAGEVGRRSGMGADAITWLAAQRAVIAGDANALDALLKTHATLLKRGQPPAYGPERGRLAPEYQGPDARTIIARNHHFDAWNDFVRWLTARAIPGSPVARFEAAVDAIVDGDLDALKRLLRAHPDLVAARSERRHHSTLLHYVGANGVESYRQKTPANAVEIARALLDAGAVVDAGAGMYGGGSTALGLVATSIHPLLAGVQDALMALLLERGAAIDDSDAGGNAHSAIASSLMNNRPQAAEFLARRGARIDLDTAAGVGDLETVRRFVADDGALRDGATAEQLARGVAWAAQFGRVDVLDFLLGHGAAPTLKRDGATPLHWAAYGAHLACVDVLLRHRAPVDAKDADFAGTPLGWALYGWATRDLDRDREPYYEVVTTLVRAGATVAPEWLSEEDRGVPMARQIDGDPRMRVALGRAGG